MYTEISRQSEASELCSMEGEGRDCDVDCVGPETEVPVSPVEELLAALGLFNAEAVDAAVS